MWKAKIVQIKKMEDTIYGLDVKKMKDRDLKNKLLQDKVLKKQEIFLPSLSFEYFHSSEIWNKISFPSGAD